MTRGGGAVRRVEAVVNIASGSVGPEAPAALEAMLSEAGVDFRIATPEGKEIERALRDAVDAAPDLVLILAGDGTARAAAELCGPTGPMLAPLPGGTMNMLPYAVYGEVDWPTALRGVLENGQERVIGGGQIGANRFLVAAILGSPALWAPAREAARDRKTKLAFLRARRALRRAFTGRLRYALDGGARHKAEAVVFMCPIASRAMSNEEPALEAAGLSPSGTVEAVRLGLHAIFDDWRNDPAVVTARCQSARVWSAEGVPALLDGESVKLDATAEVRYRPAVVRLLAPPLDPGV